MKTVLVTGGLGFIGSHAVVMLEKAGYNTIIVDNLDNSCLSTFRRIGKILNKKPTFYEVDIRDVPKMDEIFSKHKIDAVLHFAGLKVVSESIKEPLMYFDNNIIGSIRLFEVMERHSVKDIIFSSSASIYNCENHSPIPEGGRVGKTTNPYGTTKYLLERILEDLSRFAGFNVINLRYFNPIGSHPTGLIGESIDGEPTNIFPYILKVMNGELKEVKIFGHDYDTKDGTGVRDFIDINDLIDGHIKALERIEREKKNEGGFIEVYNLGTGKGTSVLELINACEKIGGKPIPHIFADRRPGDLASVYCDPKKALRGLGWEANTPIEESIRNSLKFYSTLGDEDSK